MKIICISDTHYTGEKLEELEVPSGDVLIHAGDATMRGEIAETIMFTDWFEEQPHPIKLFVPGNHDYWFERSRYPWGSGVHQLTGELFEFDGLRVFGAPWVKDMSTWAFNRTEFQISQFLDKLDAPIDILITHQPPLGILDAYLTTQRYIDKYGGDRGHLGSWAIRHFVKRVKPKLHVFGHIHESYGTHIEDSTLFVNAAILDDSYEIKHKPIVIQWDEDGVVTEMV